LKLTSLYSNTNITYLAKDLRITIDAKKMYQAMDTVWMPVTIVNLGKTPIYSGKNNQVFLSYFWIQNREVLSWEQLRTPIQADIIGTMRQDIRIAIPRNKGKLQLKVDLIGDDRWLGIHSMEEVLVY
jgi:hypothetical protein